MHEDVEATTIISCDPSPIENEKPLPEAESQGYCDALPHPDKIFAQKPTKQGEKAKDPWLRG